VTWRLDSDALCMALTSPTIADRMFRTFDKLLLQVRCAWIATGNNIQLGGDMPRRCYWIPLDAKNSQPFRRTGFRHANLRGWVKEHRDDLIVAFADHRTLLVSPGSAER
jgi:putative DNA primase/helicase